MALPVTIINQNSCFDLQFRRDIKHKRPGKPVYYAWKAQFIILGKYQEEDLLRKIQTILGCGYLNFLKQNKIRYSVQNIDNLYNKIVPFLRKQKLSGNKKKDFELWAQAIEILFQNKGKKFRTGSDSINSIKKWNKEDFTKIIEIQKKMQKFKIKKIQGEKWLSIAESISNF